MHKKNGEGGKKFIRNDEHLFKKFEELPDLLITGAKMAFEYSLAVWKNLPYGEELIKVNNALAHHYKEYLNVKKFAYSCQLSCQNWLP